MQAEAEVTYESAVARLHGEFSTLRKFLSETAPRYLLAIEDVFPKVLLLAAASYFESRLTSAVEQLAREATTDDHVLVWLVRRKAISRQYHNWFDWDKRNANQFFRLFGDGFKEQAEEWVNANDRLRNSIVDFLAIGRERNGLVHGNFGDFVLGKTAEDVVALYDSARVFVDWFPDAVRQYAGAAGAVGQG